MIRHCFHVVRNPHTGCYVRGYEQLSSSRGHSVNHKYRSLSTDVAAAPGSFNGGPPSNGHLDGVSPESG